MYFFIFWWHFRYFFESLDEKEKESISEYRQDLTPFEYFERYAKQWAKKETVKIVGGCCGIFPEHIKYLSSEISKYQWSVTTESIWRFHWELIYYNHLVHDYGFITDNILLRTTVVLCLFCSLHDNPCPFITQDRTTLIVMVHM